MPTWPVPRIGISACLLGESVRWDGGHKRDAFLTGLLGRFVEWVPVCPEVELGLGVPRDTLRLEDRGGGVRLIMRKTGHDWTEGMRAWARRRVRALEKEDLSGYVLKKDSPSCGMERVKVYPESGSPARNGRGLFAEALMEGLPGLPVEEEGRLQDLRLRESFVERVFAYQGLRAFFVPRWSLGGLVAFHTREKLRLMAHAPEAYRALGRLVATAKALARDELRTRYLTQFMAALEVPATVRKQANVLQHMAGYVSDGVDAGSRAELGAAIEEYRQGLVPVVVPLTLLRHHVRRLEVAYLAGQSYLEPHPRELMLRNHA